APRRPGFAAGSPVCITLPDLPDYRAPSGLTLPAAGTRVRALPRESIDNAGCPRPGLCRRATIADGASQQHVPRAGPPGIHGHRAGALGRTPAPGVPDLRTGMARARVARAPRPLLSVA